MRRKSSFTVTSRDSLLVSAPKIPIVARLPRHDQIFADRAVEHACFVPHRRNDAQEIGARLVAVVVRMIADAGQRAVVDDEQRELRCARALHLRRFLRLKRFRLPIQKAARREIARAHEIARERQRHLVLRRHAVAPLVVLVAQHAFARDLVGKRAIEPRRFECAVKVHQQLVLGGRAGDLFVPLDHLLVVAVHEIDLHAGDAPLLVAAETPFL